jgi:alanine dehydrogenase
MVLQFRARAIQQEEVKGIEIGNEEVKLSLFANDMILYVKEPKTRHYKQLWQSSRIQNQFTKISNLSIHQQ